MALPHNAYRPCNRRRSVRGKPSRRGEDHENASHNRCRGPAASDRVGAAAAQDVIIQPEQETVIREYVHKQPLASVEVPGIKLSIGSVLPDTVELHEVPNVKYRYVVVDNQTVVVDPGTRKIVKVIE